LADSEMARLLILLGAFACCDGVVHQLSRTIPQPGRGYVDIRGVSFNNDWYTQPKERCKGVAMKELAGGLKAKDYDEWLCSTLNGTTGEEDKCQNRWDTSRDGRVHRQCTATEASPGYFNCLAAKPCAANDCGKYSGIKTQQEASACGVYDLQKCVDDDMVNGGNCRCTTGVQHIGLAKNYEMKVGFAKTVNTCDEDPTCAGFEVLVRGLTDNDYGTFRLLKKCDKVELFPDEGVEAANKPEAFGAGTGTRVYKKGR